MRQGHFRDNLAHRMLSLNPFNSISINSWMNVVKEMLFTRNCASRTLLDHQGKVHKAIAKIVTYFSNNDRNRGKGTQWCNIFIAYCNECAAGFFCLTHSKHCPSLEEQELGIPRVDLKQLKGKISCPEEETLLLKSACVKNK